MSIPAGDQYAKSSADSVICPVCEKAMILDAGYGLWVCKECDKEEIERLYQEGKAKRAAIFNARKASVVFAEGPTHGTPGEIFQILLNTGAPGILSLKHGTKITWCSTHHPSLYPEYIRQYLVDPEAVTPKGDLKEAQKRFKEVLPEGWKIKVLHCDDEGAKMEICVCS